MSITVIFTMTLVLLTAISHYSVLRWLSGGMSQIRMSAQVRIIVIVLAVFIAHIAEIALYAAAYAVAVEALELGAFGGLAVEDPLDYFYYSVVMYTSLGLGDVFPGGHLRFITGIEALNGLVLIAWSASFIFLAMGRLWPWRECAVPSCNPPDPEK